jgi:mono/diheme cytochrome c family protein
MKRSVLSIAALAALAAPVLAQQAGIARGRYVATIGGCNDCHTAGYPQKGGQIPESEWLLGNPVGFRGPWGTSYPTNLRLTFSKMTETQWVAYAKKLQVRPPMPWFNLNKMSEADLRALYQFVKGLGASGKPAPDFVSPGTEPRTPYVVFVPQAPKQP